MSSYIRKKTPGDTDWFVHDRFGMFIHWGLYSLLARHEWIKTYERISDEAYDKYMAYFDPDLYDPRDWARRAKAAGMKYAVLTTKHHEGFCMWDTAYTDYKVTNTPAGRDLVAEYVEAFRAEGLKIGFYYSLIDWHHPDFTIDHLHPRRDDPNAQALNEGRDMHRYAEYMRNQVTELLSNYGKIDVLWFDFSYHGPTPNIEPVSAEQLKWMRGKGKDAWEAEKLIETVRSLQPHIIINDRTEIEQDLVTPEQLQPTEWPRHKETGELLTWETCQTFSGAWGYFRDEMTWKSPEMLLNLLIRTVSLGGNLIMNVGPTARGYFDKRACDALDVYADWMHYNSRSVYGCTKAEPDITAPQGCLLTQKEDGSRLYVHLLEYPFKTLRLKDMGGRVKYAQFLHDASELLFSADEKNGRDLCIELPVVKPNMIVPVVELFLQ